MLEMYNYFPAPVMFLYKLEKFLIDDQGNTVFIPGKMLVNGS